MKGCVAADPVPVCKQAGLWEVLISIRSLPIRLAACTEGDSRQLVSDVTAHASPQAGQAPYKICLSWVALLRGPRMCTAPRT